MDAIIEIIIEGLKNFAASIIGTVLLIAALIYFHPIRSLYRKHKELTEGEAESNTNLTDKEREELELLRSEKQMRELQEKADADDAKSQYILGNKYYKDGNYAEAVKWYRRAADRGHVYAIHNLGNAYYNGRGVEQNYNEAFKLYRIAADKGYAQAQYFLGNERCNGKKAFHRDYVEAFKWYMKAAEQGHAKAQCNLGNMYQNGLGVEKNYVEAAKWYRKAINNNDDKARESATKKLDAIQERLHEIQEALRH